MTLKEGPEYPVHYRGIPLFRGLIKTGEIKPGTVLMIAEDHEGGTEYRVHATGLSLLSDTNTPPVMCTPEQVLCGDKAFHISGFIPEALNNAQAQEISNEMIRQHAKHRTVLGS